MFVRPLVFGAEGTARPARPGDGLNNPATYSNAADSAQTIPVAAIQAGIYLRSGLGAGRTDTTATAAAILAANPTMDVGDSFLFLISNASAQVLTIAGGTDVTVAGTATVNASHRWFLFTKTSATTMTAHGL